MMKRRSFMSTVGVTGISLFFLTPLLAQTSVDLNTTNAGRVAFAAQNAIGYNPFNLPKNIEVALDDDIICVQTGSDSGVLQLDITDANGQVTNLVGVSGVTYTPPSQPGGARSLQATLGSNIACFNPPQPPAQPIGVDLSVPVCQLGDSDVLFRDGFETFITGEVDIQVALRLLQNPSLPGAAPGQNEPLMYEVHVMNCGTGTATEISVRDLFPHNFGELPLLDAQSTYTCDANTTCPSQTENYIEGTIASLDPGQSAVFVATRALDPSASGADGDEIAITAVAATSNTEDMISNNVAVATYRVNQTNNLPPTIALSSGTAFDPIIEDGGTATLTGVSFMAGDTDGSVADILVTSSDSSALTVNAVNFTAPAAQVADLSIMVTPGSNRTGVVNLMIRAVDDQGLPSAALTIPVTITAVNDPPSLVTKGGFGFNGTMFIDNGTTCTIGSAVGCADLLVPSNTGSLQVIISRFILSTTPGGGADELSQNISLSLQVSDGSSIFVGSPLLDDDGDLFYTLGGNSGTAQLTVVADDGQSENNTAAFSFNVIVDNGVPVINTVVGGFNIDENSATDTQVGTLTAVDPEGEALQNWQIIAGNIDVDADTNLAFKIDPDSGLIQVNDMDDLNAEMLSSFALMVQVEDINGGVSAPLTLDIGINDINDAPTINVGQTLMVSAVASVGDIVGSGAIQGNDEDQDTLQNWQIASIPFDPNGNGTNAFRLDPMTGELIVNDAGDLPLTSLVALVITVSDGQLTSAPVSVTVQVVN